MIQEGPGRETPTFVGGRCVAGVQPLHQPPAGLFAALPDVQPDDLCVGTGQTTSGGIHIRVAKWVAGGHALSQRHSTPKTSSEDRAMSPGRAAPESGSQSHIQAKGAKGHGRCRTANPLQPPPRSPFQVFSSLPLLLRHPSCTTPCNVSPSPTPSPHPTPVPCTVTCTKAQVQCTRMNGQRCRALPDPRPKACTKAARGAHTICLPAASST